MSIAKTNFSFLLNGYQIGSMQTIEDTRRQRLLMLIKLAGSQKAIKDKLELDPADSTISQVVNASKHSTTGSPRQMGSQFARRLEVAYEKPTGWMDTPPTYAELLGEEDPALEVHKVTERMSPDVQRLYAEFGRTLVQQRVFSPPTQPGAPTNSNAAAIKPKEPPNGGA